MLIDKRVKVGTIESLMQLPDAWIQDYFQGPRGRAALAGGGTAIHELPRQVEASGTHQGWEGA